MNGWEPIDASIEREKYRGGRLSSFQRWHLREVLLGEMVMDPLSSTWEENEIVEGATVSLQFDPPRWQGTLIGHWPRYVRSVASLGEGRLASGSDDCTIKIWNTQIAACERTLEGHSGDVSSVACLGEGRLASGSWDKTIKIWNTETGDCERTLEGHSNDVYSVASLGEGRLASGSGDETIKIMEY